jgi:hypothetical protein
VDEADLLAEAELQQLRAFLGRGLIGASLSSPAADPISLAACLHVRPSPAITSGSSRC